ncbi:MAG TPA: 3'-5' exonuclease, partial [Patescibacteria group bacterium]
MKFLQGMLQHFSRLKDDDITPTQYFDYAKKLTGDADEIKKTLELAQAFKKYEDLKIKAGVMDFSDLISNVLKLFRTRKNVLKRYQQLFKYILVDEFQDTNYAQNEMAILLAGDKQNITVVGDDDQCLPGNTLITTQHGKKEIKSIKIGEKILTAVGKGSLGISTVNKVFKNKKNTNFITLTTKSGVTITATENHKMFCYIPKKVINKQFYYVYLMYRQNLGWRLGTTNDLAVRLKLERSADAIIGLRAFKTVDEARYHELLWSLQYQIPTSIFKERDGIMLQGKLIEKLYKQIDTNTNAKKLADDLGINITNYHYILDAVTRGQSNRVKINVYQCYRNYTQKRIYSNNIMQNALITHLVQLETSNLAIIDQLNKHSIPFKKAKKGIRVRFSSSNIIEVTDLAEKLAHITGGFIEMQSVIGTLHKVNMPALIIPAGNLLEGLYVPIIKNKQVYYDEIIDIKREQKTAVVYDLEINKTHNFIANNIVVHNSIYRWRGAAISNMMQFRSHFPQAKIITLNKNYRSTQTILDSAYQMIQNNNPDRLEVKEKIDKHLIAMRGAISNEIEFIYTNKVEEEAEQIAKKIREEVKKTNRPYNEFAILVRANDHAIPFQRALDRLKIPYQFLGPEHLFEQAEIKDLIAYLHTLTNFEETSSLYRVLTISTFGIEARDVAAILNFSKKNNLSLFEAMEKVANTTLTENGKERITKIVTMLKNHLAQIPHETAGQILYNFFEDSGLLAYYLDPRSAKTEKEAQNVAKFFNKIQSFSSNTADASVFAVVDWLDMSMELGESPLSAEIDWTRNNAVNILTIHASKGLEFPFVFVTNLVTQRFPSRNRQEQIPVPSAIIREELPTGDENIQEERRLFYVAVTRAKDKLFLTASRFYGDGKRERKLSPFVIETLDEKNLKKILKKQTIEPAAQQLSLLDMFNANIQQQEEKSKTENFQLSTSNSPLHNITYISYSQLQTFQTCPLHYKLRYIMNVPSAPAPALSYGISIHSTLRDF